MQDNDIVSAAPSTIVIADAITGATKSKQDTLVFYPEDKELIQDLKVEFGLKSDKEAGNLIVQAALKYRYDEDGNDRFADIAILIDEERELRKIIEKEKKQEEERINNAMRKAAILARKAAAGI
jgi:hypothetical protein